MRSSFYIFEFLEIIPPFPGRGIISTPVTPCLGPRYRTSRENAILVTTGKPFLPFTPSPLSSYDSKRLSTGRQRPTPAQLEVSDRLLWMDGRMEGILPSNTEKLTSRFYFQPPPINSVFSARSIHDPSCVEICPVRD